jgi:serine O-acetyltransferase
MTAVITGVVGDCRVFRSRYEASLLQFVVHPSHPALWLFRTAAAGPRVLALVARNVLMLTYACDVQHGAQFDPGILLPHPTGIVIGSGVHVEHDTLIFQNVTIREHATLYAGCTVCGPIEVGERARVGSNRVVLSTVDADATVHS